MADDIKHKDPAVSLTGAEGEWDTKIDNGSLNVIEANVLQPREIGVLGAISLIVNKIVGAGIFSTPATIFKLSGSVGMALMVWVIAGIISTCGALVMLELGCKVSASNAITSSSYLLLAAGVESTTWKLRGIAIAAAAFAVGIHAVAPKVGRVLQDILGAVKIFILMFIVSTGFAALAGHLRIPSPDNFNVATSFQGTSNNGYNIGTAILNGIFSFQGYDNVNAVLSEVKNPQRTLRIALPSAMAMVTVLYLLANVAYFAAVPKDQFISSDITIAATLFQNVFGDSAATKALPALVSISAIGHLLGIAYTVPRVIQELAKDGVMPFANIVMENRPFRTPIFALAIHLGVTVLFVCAPPAGDAFNFIVGLSSYPTTFLLTVITVGLIKLRFTDKENFKSSFSTPWVIISLYLAGNILHARYGDHTWSVQVEHFILYINRVEFLNGFLESGFANNTTQKELQILCFPGFLFHALSLLWIYLKPSKITRYLHTTDGKSAWALVTGASGGIGKNIAFQLAGLGFNVLLHGRSIAKLKTLESELLQKYPGREFRILVLDAAQCFNKFGDTTMSNELLVQTGDINLTIVINNAGGSTERSLGPLEHLSADRVITDASVNALFPTLLVRQLIPVLQHNAPALIINIGSLADLGVTLTGSYAASKAYLMKLTEVLSREMRLGRHDVEVLGVRVGNVWGTGQTVAAAPGLFAPDATTMARAVLARVGCGRIVVVGHWAHAVQFGAIQLLPGFIREYFLTHAAGDWEMESEHKKSI
ncbi:amino acid/polyamine transporter I [Penicillium angulare]|uniref:Amino acid/polyamine transporter I n=1 Tax=Penicillium angulare TaxID=116970 RepID=A0A9W9K8A6_9EURO|nr:amino acid/polyamine transporter I [Penicillium angulare]